MSNTLPRAERLVWIAAIMLIVGISLLVLAYFLSSSEAHRYPLAAFLVMNIAALLIFTMSYTLLSEFRLKKDFAKDLSESIDSKLRRSELNETISRLHLDEVHDRFTDERLFSRLQNASSLKMLAMRSDTFFRDYHEAIRARISAGQLILEVMLSDPTEIELMQMLSTRYTDLASANELAASIATTANTWLIKGIFARLSQEERTGRMKLCFCRRYPLYSAYLFDNRELWYIPYHYRRDRQKIPTFVFRHNLDEVEVYRDFVSLWDNKEDVVEHDLTTSVSVK